MVPCFSLFLLLLLFVCMCLCLLLQICHGACVETGQFGHLSVTKDAGIELRGHQACQTPHSWSHLVDPAQEHFYHASYNVQIMNPLNISVKPPESDINCY